MTHRQQVRCVRLPLQGVSLLLPYACVAEIASLSLRAGPGACLGVAEWRGLRVPVVSLDRGCNMAVDVPRGRIRIAVLYGLRDPVRRPYYAIMLHGVPRTESLAAGQLEDAGEAGCKLLGLGGRMEGQVVFVPDLEALEVWIDAACEGAAAS